MLSIDPGESILHPICVSTFGIDWSVCGTKFALKRFQKFVAFLNPYILMIL